MSRTDKDRPSWVRSNDKSAPRKAYHRQYSYRSDIVTCWQECTVNISHEAPRHVKNHDKQTPCGYLAEDKWSRGNTPNEIDRRNLAHGPTRRAERDYGRSVADYYNTYGNDEYFDAHCENDVLIVERNLLWWWW